MRSCRWQLKIIEVTGRVKSKRGVDGAISELMTKKMDEHRGRGQSDRMQRRARRTATWNYNRERDCMRRSTQSTRHASCTACQWMITDLPAYVTSSSSSSSSSSSRCSYSCHGNQSPTAAHRVTAQSKQIIMSLLSDAEQNANRWVIGNTCVNNWCSQLNSHQTPFNHFSEAIQCYVYTCVVLN